MTYGTKSTENRRKKHIRPGNDLWIGKLGLGIHQPDEFGLFRREQEVTGEKVQAYIAEWDNRAEANPTAKWKKRRVVEPTRFDGQLAKFF